MKDTSARGKVGADGARARRENAHESRRISPAAREVPFRGIFLSYVVRRVAERLAATTTTTRSSQ